jgi:hypothetical protein
MWGYGRADDSGLVVYKSQNEHFELFCMVMERGFPIHTGNTDRLVMEFRLTDTGSNRYLPKVQAKSGISFLLPEAWLKPSDLYLYYDPANEEDIPQLAHFCPETNQFKPCDYEDDEFFDRAHDKIQLPIVKLSTLKGLHYIKDIACLQLFEADFDYLYSQDPALAEQVRNSLAEKLKRYIHFARPWAKADNAERVALEYLEQHGRPSKPATPFTADTHSANNHSPNNHSPINHSDPEFLSWD